MLKQKVTFLEQTWKTVEFTAETEEELDALVDEALDDISETINFEKNPDSYQVETVNRYPIEEVNA